MILEDGVAGLCAKIACKENQRMHARIVGLKFLDVAVNLRGEYVFTYGEV